MPRSKIPHALASESTLKPSSTGSLMCRVSNRLGKPSDKNSLPTKVQNTLQQSRLGQRRIAKKGLRPPIELVTPLAVRQGDTPISVCNLLSRASELGSNLREGESLSFSTL